MDWQTCSLELIVAVIATGVLILTLFVNSYQSKKSLDEIRKARWIEVYRNIEKDRYDIVNSQINQNYIGFIRQNPTIKEAVHREPFLRTEQDYETVYKQYINEIRELDEQITTEFRMKDPMVNILNFFKSVNRYIDNEWITAEYVYGFIGGNILDYWRLLYLLVYHFSYEAHYPHYQGFNSLVDKMDKVRIDRQKQ